MESVDSEFWGPPPELLRFGSDKEFQELTSFCHESILTILRLHPYNTLESFSKFYHQYREERQLHESLESFIESLPATVSETSASCVGLSAKLWKLIIKAKPNLETYLFYASGNEFSFSTKVPESDLPPSWQLAKNMEHILIAIEFSLSERGGYIILDLGYGLDFPIIVMKDGLSPHTGPITLTSRIGYREFDLEMASKSSKFMRLSYKAMQGEGLIMGHHQKIMYLGRKTQVPGFLERRSYLYPYHAYTLMGPGGLLDGLYFVLGKDNRRFTIYIKDESGEVSSEHLPYEYFLPSFDQSTVEFKVTDAAEKVLEKFFSLCGFEDVRLIRNKLSSVSEACCDESFIQEVISLDTRYRVEIEASVEIE